MLKSLRKAKNAKIIVELFTFFWQLSKLATFLMEISTSHFFVFETAKMAFGTT